jgi:integrase
MSQLVFEALKRQHAATGKVRTLCSATGSQAAGSQERDEPGLVSAPPSPGPQDGRPYQCRHTAATLWLAAGEAPEWIARQLGHTTTEMLFRVYSRYVPNLTRRDGSAFERLITQSIADTPAR